MSQELLSSVTVSTGSFLSYEVTDLSLTDPGTIKLCECSEEAALAAHQCGDGGSAASPCCVLVVCLGESCLRPTRKTSLLNRIL